MTATPISCSEYSFPAVPGQRERTGVVRLLGFELGDVALFLADGGGLVADPAGIAAALRAALSEHGLASENLFLAVGESVEDIAPNQRDRPSGTGGGVRPPSRRVIAMCESHPDVETCFARLAGVGERSRASMEGLAVGLTDERGELVRYEEDWHLD